MYSKVLRYHGKIYLLVCYILVTFKDMFLHAQLHIVLVLSIYFTCPKFNFNVYT